MTDKTSYCNYYLTVIAKYSPMKHFYTIDEVKRLLRGSIIKRLPPCEQSDINQQILREHELGFEAILTGKGEEKILLPEDGSVVFLYRGQNREFSPCFPHFIV